MAKKPIFAKREILPLGLIVLSFIAGLMLYQFLPQDIPSHWGPTGEIDAWMQKNMSVILFPVLTLLVYVLMTLAPAFDPLRENYAKFLMPYYWFRTATVVFLILMYFYSLWVALGGQLEVVYFIIPIISIYFILLGFFLPKVKQNYFVGIRTPWTLHNEAVWEKTHKFGERIFIGAGVLSLFTILSPQYAFALFITIILIAAAIPISYSYYAYKWMEKKK